MATLIEPFAPWLRDINRLLTSESAPAPFIPPADVVVSDEGVTIHMDVPGLRAEDVEIDLDNDTLTIRGERRYPYQGDDGQRAWRHIERRFGRFERSLRVPSGMDAGAIDAELTDGVLTVHLPKPASARPRRVEVKAAAQGNGASAAGDEAGTTSQGEAATVEGTAS